MSASAGFETGDSHRRRRLISWRFRARAGAAVRISAAQIRHIAQVEALIRAEPAVMERGACPCGDVAGDVIACVDRYGLQLDTMLCARCGTLRFDPYLSPETLSRFYELHYQDMYERVLDTEVYFERQREYGRRVARWMLGHATSSRVVVEVGCGAGGALDVLAEAGHVVHGCDLSARLIDYGLGRNVPNLCTGELDALERRSPGLRADVLLLHHVFEHLASPVAWLMSARELLAEGGSVVIAVPDINRIEGYRWPDGDLRLMLHLAHKFNFTLEGLQAVATRAGMRAFVPDIAPSPEAPERWVAFARSTPAWLEQQEGKLANAATAKQVDRELRTVERRYLRTAVLRRLCRWWKAISRRALNRANASPSQAGSEDREP